ncbi:MAG: queuosine precursor transporter [Chitinophagales bacterium]
MAASIINANIKFIRKQKSMTQQSFADLIGIKRSSLGAYEEGRAKPNYETIQTIARKFNISIDKLLTQDLAKIADESVFGTGATPIHTHSSRSSNPTVDIEGKKLRVLSITVDENDNENIELVAEKARAGYLDGYADPEYIEKLSKFRLPFLPQGTYRAFEIKGDSMLPLQPGSVVVGEYVDDWLNVKNNETYIVVFHRIKKLTGENKIWLRATGSTLVSQFIDSFVVLYIAFVLGPQQWGIGLFLAVGCVNYSYKFMMAVVLTPVIYLAHHLIDNYLGVELARKMKMEAIEK